MNQLLQVVVCFSNKNRQILLSKETLYLLLFWYHDVDGNCARIIKLSECYEFVKIMMYLILYVKSKILLLLIQHGYIWAHIFAKIVILLDFSGIIICYKGQNESSFVSKTRILKLSKLSCCNEKYHNYTRYFKM